MDFMHQRGLLLMMAGEVLRPIRELAENPQQVDAAERARIIGRFKSDDMRFSLALEDFAVAQRGHNYRDVILICHQALKRLGELLREGGPSLETFEALRGWILDGIHAIPVPLDSRTFEATTAFSAYMYLRDVCLNARDNLLVVDRYLSDTLFHRMLEAVPTGTPAIVVTWPRSRFNRPRDLQRYDAFMDVSRLFAQERGPAGYWLLTNEQIHDRHVMTKGILLSLGGSLNAIGEPNPYSVAKMPETERGLVWSYVTNATEVFGVNQTTHP